MKIVLSILLLPLIIILYKVLYIIPMEKKKLKEKMKKNKQIKIAFFHPFCDSGGGGERVLWNAIETILKKYSNIEIYIYMRENNLNSKEILEKIKKQFNVNVNENKINFIQLKLWKLTVAESYPILRLLLQSVGTVLVSLEALLKFKPDIYVETVGFAFTYPLVKLLFNCHIVSYVHYPTISSDMLNRVKNREQNITNSETISKNKVLSFLKYIYYIIFSKMYGFVGSFADSVMTNSTWTYNHIINLWRCPEKTRIVYPPCDSSYLSSFPIDNERKRVIVSVAQFRPEKAHTLQLEALAKMIKKYPEYVNNENKFVKLVLIGGCRNENDEKIVNNLKSLAKKLNIEKYVEILTNLPYEELCNYFKTSLIGIHTMKDEHFGISIIEYMASGLIALANNSAGPKLDIIVNNDENEKTGYLASSCEEYSEKLHEILEMSENEKMKLRNNARKHVNKKFSIEKFENDFLDSLFMNI